MRKVVSFMLAVVAIVCLMSCGGNSKSESNTTSADDMQREEVNFNPEDGKAASSQYTNLEIYLNELVEKITTDQIAGGVVLSGQQNVIIPTLMRVRW